MADKRSEYGEGMTVVREWKLEDYLAVVQRRRWLLLIPALAGAFLGYISSLYLPKQYTSHTVILVEQPTVPDNYVKPVVSEDLNQRLASMREQILSRTRLQQLVEHFGLFQAEPQWAPVRILSRLLHKTDAKQV